MSLVGSCNVSVVEREANEALQAQVLCAHVAERVGQAVLLYSEPVESSLCPVLAIQITASCIHPALMLQRHEPVSQSYPEKDNAVSDQSFLYQTKHLCIGCQREISWQGWGPC